MTTRFSQALKHQNTSTPPIWFMRQAGRYHAHYQNLRRQYSFMDLCKRPDIACEVTMGPIEDFGFDAAILFSDLLFPLEAMGMGLTYEPGPKLAWHLKSPEDLNRLTRPEVVRGSRAHFMEFQAEAMRLIRKRLPSDKGLIGFVGGPFTLFCYAVEGSHAGELVDSKLGLTDGRFAGFLELLVGMLADNMILQARAGADTVAMLDTCAGEVDAAIYEKHVVPAIAAVLERFKAACPETPVTYYSKKTDPAHWRKLNGLPIAVLGIDWRHDLASVIRDFGQQYGIQGNIDPSWLHLPGDELEAKARAVFESIRDLDLTGYVCGLGHGVLQHTPEENVHRLIRVAREVLARGDS